MDRLFVTSINAKAPYQVKFELETESYLFTSPRDKHLKDTVIAIIEEFLSITNSIIYR